MAEVKLVASLKGMQKISKEYNLDIPALKGWMQKIKRNLDSVIEKHQEKVILGTSDIIILRDVREEAFSINTPFLDTLYDFCMCIKGYDDAVADYMEKKICSLDGYESMKYVFPWKEEDRKRFYNSDEDYINDNYNSIRFKKL